jgi:hypothetical protein
MKIRFGEFPEAHHFLQVMRPPIEWTFKIVGWIIIVATLRYGAQKTHNQILLYFSWALDLLILTFIFGFLQWFFSFRRYPKPISGKALVRLAEKSEQVEKRKYFKTNYLFRKMLTVVLAGISLLITITIQITANIAVEQVINAIIEAQIRTR